MGTIKNHASIQTQTKQNLVGIIQPFRKWHHVVSEFNQKITTGSQRASNTTF